MKLVKNAFPIINKLIPENDNVSAFNAIEYDEKIKRTLPYFEEFYKQVIDIVNIHFGGPVTWLDIGCGTGKMEEVAFISGNIEKIVACDISEKMIAIVKKRFEDKNIELITASIFDVCTDTKFDVVTAIQVFHYLQREERIEAIRKCYEALNPNGIFITFENFAPYSEPGKCLFLKRWKSFQLSQGKSMEESNRHIGRYGKAYFPITISEHLEVFKQCGFVNVEILWVSNMQVGLLGVKSNTL